MIGVSYTDGDVWVVAFCTVKMRLTKSVATAPAWLLLARPNILQSPSITISVPTSKFALFGTNV